MLEGNEEEFKTETTNQRGNPWILDKTEMETLLPRKSTHSENLTN